jgi:two-component system sensor kinase FixL
MQRAAVHWWQHPKAASRYAVAILLIAAAIALEWHVRAAATVSLLLCAIILATWFGGLGPGLLATVAALLGFAYFIVPPSLSFLIEEEHVIRLILFGVVSTVVVLLIAAQKQSTESLRKARDDLAAKNEALEGEIVQRIRTEAKLREQAQLLDLTHDTVFVRDMNDVITYWNRGAEERYGWKSNEAIGRISHELTQTTFPASLAKINEELRRTGRWEGELVHQTRDGSRIVVSSRWSLQQDAERGATAVLETNNDITERKRAEEGLRQAQAELAHFNRVTTMGQLAASIAHEVNQPVTGVAANAHAALRFLQLDPPDVQEARDALIDIVKNSDRAAEVVARIRALMRKTPPRYDWLDLDEAILEVVALTRDEAIRAGVVLETELARHMPQIQGDRVQLQQVMLNLIVNAIQASSQVSSTRRVVVVANAAGSERASITVRDSGVGLDPARSDRLFEAFYTTKATGMGMGLAICRSIIESHGGRIWAEPNKPQGAVFSIDLPLQQESTA